MKEENVGGLLVLLGLAVLGWWLLAPQSFDRTRYGTAHVQPRPIDCDFFTAPMGHKGCYYTRRAETWGGTTWVGYEKSYDKDD